MTTSGAPAPRWCARSELSPARAAPRIETGKPCPGGPALKRKRWVGSYETRREARDAEREASRRAPQGLTGDCAAFAIRWVDDYARPAAAKVRTNRYAVKKFAEDFRGVPLAKVDRPTTVDRCRRLIDEPPHSPRRGHAVQARSAQG